MRIVGWVTIYVGVTWLLLLATGWTHTLWADLALAGVVLWSVCLWLGCMYEYYRREDHRELWRLVNRVEEAERKMNK